MCLVTKQKRSRQTTKNLIVFKNTTSYKIHSNFFISEYYDKFKYLKGKKSPVIPKLKIDGWGDVNVGYHSFEELKDAKSYSPYNIGIFLIPKGSRIIKGYENGGERKSIVSSQIVYLGVYSDELLQSVSKKYLKNDNSNKISKGKSKSSV